jgi:hypothetical protein
MRFLQKSNPALGNQVRRLCGASEKEKYVMAETIAREGTSNDIYCALVFGRFEDYAPTGGPYRSAANRFMPLEVEDLLCTAYIEKTKVEIALLKGFVCGARESGERAAAAIEELEYGEAKTRQIAYLRSRGVSPLAVLSKD